MFKILKKYSFKYVLAATWVAYDVNPNFLNFLKIYIYYGYVKRPVWAMTWHNISNKIQLII